MEVQQAWQSTYKTDPETLVLPSVPQHDPASRPAASGLSLPAIKSLGLPDVYTAKSSTNGHTQYWKPLQANSLPSVPTTAPQSSIETIGSPMETESVTSFEGYNGHRNGSIISIDDPEARMAAEALSGLRNLGAYNGSWRPTETELTASDFVRSPTIQPASVKTPQPEQWQRPMSPQEEKESSEPLLQLLTTSHPWLGNTINGSLTAYNTTKNYSPAFVRSSADFLERNVGSTVASTVGSVSKRTGVESGLRRYLGERRPSDQENPSSKRRRVKESSPEAEDDIEKGLSSPPIYRYRSRTGSQASFATMESLPAYDDNRSPNYEEATSVTTTSPPPQSASQHRTALSERRASHNWRTQLMITTSGLGAALHHNSLRSLKYCLRLLKNATDHVAAVMDALKSLLNQYAASQQRNGVDGDAAYVLTEEQLAASHAISERIRAMGEDIMNTMRSVVESVSRYAGGALPDNASALVRRQLMSVPQRWRAALETGDANSSQTQDEAVRAGNRALEFANQSLDMFAQLSMVLSSTIDSAESWLETMGRSRERSETLAVQGNGHRQGDEKNGVNGDAQMDEKH